MNAFRDYIRLPAEVTAFEAGYLARVNRAALWFFLAHLPLFAAVAAVNGSGVQDALLLTAAALAGPALAVGRCPPRTTSVVMGVTAMFLGGILVHIGQGPVQIEMHFYFFVLIALLVVFANPAVVLAAAGTAIVHHAAVWLVWPASVFNYDAPLWVLGVHDAFVVVEAVVTCVIARSFFDNVVGLERIVAVRTAEVDARNRDMRLLLDAVEQGFFTVDGRGLVSAERSAAVDRWLGPPADPDDTLPARVRRHDPTVAEWLALGLDDVFADLLPVSVTVDQLPKRLRLADRTVRLDYAPIPRDGPPQALAVVMTDVTVAVERERLETEHRVLLTMVDRIGRDKAGFLEFVKETDEILGDLATAAADLADVRRKVHTLKGNAGVFGLDSVAAACHAIEDHIADTGTPPEAADWARLNSQWESVRDNLKRLVGDAPTGVTLGDDEYMLILLAVLNGAPREVLSRRIAEWRLEPTGLRMARIGDHARVLAARLQKGDIEVRVRGGHLRTDPDQWGLFWSVFVHLVRNAVDHGLESPADRAALGKPVPGVIELETRIDGDRFVVSMTDDGRGINWERVSAAARAKGLPADTCEELVEALFHDGLSTAATVSSVSGRGVGMGAVRAACLDLGGCLRVRSESGKGTTFEFRFPVEAMAPDTHALLRLHGVSYRDTPTHAAVSPPGQPAAIASPEPAGPRWLSQATTEPVRNDHDPTGVFTDRPV